jgi:hypothetical protein
MKTMRVLHSMPNYAIFSHPMVCSRTSIFKPSELPTRVQPTPPPPFSRAYQVKVANIALISLGGGPISHTKRISKTLTPDCFSKKATSRCLDSKGRKRNKRRDISNKEQKNTPERRAKNREKRSPTHKEHTQKRTVTKTTAASAR